MTASFSSAAAYFLPLISVAAHLRRVLWVCAMNLFARSRLLLLCGCVFFALFKPYGVPPPRAAAECPHTHHAAGRPSRRYLDCGDQLLRYTFTGLSLCGTYMCSAAVLLCVCVCRIRVRVRTCHTTSPFSSAPAVQIPTITYECVRIGTCHTTSPSASGPVVQIPSITCECIRVRTCHTY